LVIVLIWAVALGTTARHFYCSKMKGEVVIMRKAMCTTLLYLAANLIAYFCIFLLTTLTLSKNADFYSERGEGTPTGQGYPILMSIVSFSASIGYLSLIQHLTRRLYYSFKDSVYQVPKRTIHIHLFLSVVCIVLFNLYAFIYFFADSHQSNDWLNLALPIALSAEVINLYLAFSLLYRFTDKLMLLVAKMGGPEEHPAIRAMLFTATKHCLLGLIGISMFNVMIPLTVSSYVWLFTLFGEHNIVQFLVTAVLCFVWHSIEMASMLFEFSFNKGYYRVLCGFCDGRCRALLKTIVDNKKPQPVPSATVTVTVRKADISGHATVDSSSVIVDNVSPPIPSVEITEIV